MKYRLLALAMFAVAGALPAAEMLSPALPSAATEAMPGLKVGAKAPDFTLKNASGEDVALSALLEKGKVALAFVRSADWCPFCRAQLQSLQKSLKDIDATGVQLISVSYDSPAVLAAAAKKLGVTFPILSDTGSKVIDAYGVRNQEATGRGVGIPHPVVFILDQQGTIRAKLMRDGYRTRPESVEIIAAVQSIK